jgi:DNA polymerase III delta subunit
VDAVSATELKPAYLISGNDRPKVEVALGRLRARFDPGSIERLVAGGKDGASGGDVVAACNAGTLLGGDRLVLVTEVDGRRGEWDRLAGGWKAADVEAVVAYLSAPAPGTVLCLVGEELKKDSPLAKACGKVGDVLIWEVVKKDVVGWVARAFQERGVKIGGDACRLLVDIVGDDKLALALEIDKLATWADGEPLGVDEVQRLATPLSHEPPWALTDAWGKRDVGAALAIVEAAFDQSPRPRRDEAAALGARLGAHLTRLTRMRALLEEGLRPREAAAKLGMKPFPGEKLARQAEEFSLEELRDAAVRLARLDHALKGGSKLAPDLELQLAVADVAREPR